MNRYSDILADHMQAPHNRGPMNDADLRGMGSLHGTAPFVQVYLKSAADGRIERAGFDAWGCGFTVAAASMLTELVEGQSREFALTLTPKDVVTAFEEYPIDREYCAWVAVAALHNALSSPPPPAE